SIACSCPSVSARASRRLIGGLNLFLFGFRPRIVSELLPGPGHLDQRRSGVSLAYDARQSQAFGRVTFTLFGFAHWLAPPLECRSNPWRNLQFLDALKLFANGR